MNAIGQRIEGRMRELGLTDEALAHQSDVTVKTIWRLRNGKSYPRAGTARRIADCLELPVAELRPRTTLEPELREILNDIVSRLRRIERAIERDAA